MDVLRWHFKNVTEHLKDVLAIEVLKWLGSKQSWRKNSGKDHVFVLGKISWDFRRNNKFASLVSVCIPVISVLSVRMAFTGGSSDILGVYKQRRFEGKESECD
ncbi:unnamed protein product [Brassica oleracea]|uniref:Exostosin GT47 domain-containing protein n=1 Tax=Brassica oleracea TaxID=3712 RepID=A0A3P6C4D1_BRAOL|nr:unnamed protein product [Brassica oleracea]